MVGYDFYTHINSLILDRDYAKFRQKQKVGTTATYPDLLHMTHFYSLYRTTTAIG